MRNTIIISLSILLSLSIYAQESTQCHLKKGEKFAVVEIKTKRYRAKSYQHYNALATKNNKNPKLLYKVVLTDKKTNLTRILGLVSTVNRPLTSKDLNSIGYRGHNHKASKTKQLIPNSPQYDKLKKEWQLEYKNFLMEKAGLYEDTELEYLLSLKFFHETLPNIYKTWKKNYILDFLYRLSGLQDIQSAIPLKKNFSVNNHLYTEKAPAPLTLPKIAVPETKGSASDYPLAALVPRSCYYLEFANIQALNKALEFASGQFNKWSKNTYPKTFKQAINDTLSQCGLLPETLEKSGKYGRIAIAGWDPYYQSGTSLLIILEKGTPTNDKKSFQKNGYGIYSNSPKLLSMSKNAFEKKRSLFHDPAFLHSRKNLQKNDNERFFLYLSDYWLTNLLSPRWQILSGRLAECDARIRLTEILRLSTKVDHNLKTLPSVKQMKNIYKDHKELTWIMRDLKTNEKGVVHTEYGGLNQHPAIDQIPFGKVSVHEKKTYEKFKTTYSANWREMDPLAFQVNQEKDHWYNRLYISPISRISDFRQLTQVVLPVKEKHQLRDIPSSAFGLSLKFATTLFRPFTHFKVPQKIQLSLRGLDMAPHVDTLKYIHKEQRNHDQWSFSRLPIMLEAPSLLLSIISPIIRTQERPSDYKGLTLLTNISNDWLYNIFIRQGDDGYSQAAINPMALLGMTENMGKVHDTSQASDIYFYLDFLKGYMLHRYLTLELAKNRILANWRRTNRSQRIINTFEEPLAKTIFPQANNLYYTDDVPLPKSDNNDWSRGPSNQVKHLPELLRLLKKIEVFISVDKNAISFDSKVYFKKDPSAMRLPRTQTPGAEEISEDENNLDFDQ
jgi:hypothetical protein